MIKRLFTSVLAAVMALGVAVFPASASAAEQYVYADDPTVGMQLPYASIAAINDSAYASRAINFAGTSMTAAQKASANGIAAYCDFAEEVMARVTFKLIKEAPCVIDKALLDTQVLSSNYAYNEIATDFYKSEIKQAREVLRTGGVRTTVGTANVSIDPSVSKTIFDIVRISTSSAKLRVEVPTKQLASFTDGKKLNFKIEFGADKLTITGLTGSGVYVDVGLPAITGNVDFQTVAVGGVPMPSMYRREAHYITTNVDGVYTVVNNEKNFSDIGLLHPTVQHAIKMLSAKEIIGGVEAGKFDPAGSVTRAQMSKIICLATYRYNPAAKSEFTDVPAASWFAPYVASAKAYGYLNGYPGGKFEPNVALPRDQLVAICARAMQGKYKFKPIDTATLLTFTDAAAIPAWARDPVARAVNQQLIAPTASGAFNPSSPVNRADAAYMIAEMFRKLG